jgi:glutathione synthase/RimK-type ligase-like ATP-grasp enzyme
MKRCAFLTLHDPTGYVIDDEHAREPLRTMGCEMEMVPWDSEGAAWEDYAIVVIRSPWDWVHAPQRFVEVLAGIDARVQLQNPLAIVRWNLDKTYLRELAARGVAIVPTIYRDRIAPAELDALLHELGTRDAVVKPVVACNAEGAHRLPERSVAEVETYFASRPSMTQPFVRSVIEEGEYSLFFFDGEYSHAVRKVPKAGDFRVQEEHGGAIESVVASASLREAAQAVIAAVGTKLLYARVDLVRGDRDAWWLMELEAVEPSLYLRMDPAAPERFARAIVRRL